VGVVTTAAGLSEQELAQVREAVAAGRRPKVVFTAAAGQMAGQVGQVVAVGEPGQAEDFLTVRFGRDELPFSPADVAVAPRGAGRARPAAAAAPQEVAQPVAEFVLDRPALPPRPAAVAQPAAAVPEQPAGDRPAGKAPRRGRAAKPALGLTVTLAYAEGEWTVAAEQAGRVLARPYMVRPVEALRFVALVDVPGVREAVEQILAAERAQAEQQAQRLRAELAEVEARLAELQDAG
jgi:hypothetical protein